jgi:hypothetical protein
MDADLAFSPPPGWTATDLAPLTLGAGSEVAIDRWNAWAAPDGAPGRAVSACLGVDLDAWIDEATPVALERLAAAAGRVAGGLDGAMTSLHVVGEERTAVTAGQTLARSRGVGVGVDVDARGVARTVLGFTTMRGPMPGDARAPARTRGRGCFVVCAPTTLECEHAMSAAVAVGFVAPPPPGAVGRGLACGVHHPRAVAASCASLLLLAGIVAVWTRPRTRRARK